MKESTICTKTTFWERGDAENTLEGPSSWEDNARRADQEWKNDFGPEERVESPYQKRLHQNVCGKSKTRRSGKTAPANPPKKQSASPFDLESRGGAAHNLGGPRPPQRIKAAGTSPAFRPPQEELKRLGKTETHRENPPKRFGTIPEQGGRASTSACPHRRKSQECRTQASSLTKGTE